MGIMFKRFFIICLATVSLISCGVGSKATSPKLNTSATYQRLSVQPYVTPVQVDLSVSPNKISYFMLVSESVRQGGLDNVIATAVKEALESNGDADVLVGLQTQVKYNDKGEIESISLTGFPAKYVNFRSNDKLPFPEPQQETSSSASASLPFLGKK